MSRDTKRDAENGVERVYIEDVTTPGRADNKTGWRQTKLTASTGIWPAYQVVRYSPPGSLICPLRYLGPQLMA